MFKVGQKVRCLPEEEVKKNQKRITIWQEMKPHFGKISTVSRIEEDTKGNPYAIQIKECDNALWFDSMWFVENLVPRKVKASELV